MQYYITLQTSRGSAHFASVFIVFLCYFFNILSIFSIKSDYRLLALSLTYFLHFLTSDDFENHAIAIKNQYPVPTGITAFGAVLGLAFGADPDTTETCGLESRSDQRYI